MITFEIPGVAVGKSSSRFDPRSRRSYYPKSTTDWMKRVAVFGKLSAPRIPLSGPIELTIIVSIVPPKSWSKTKRVTALSMGFYPTSKPDCDNYSKGICDALTGIMWNDDAQVVDLHVTKIYGEFPVTMVTVRALDGQE